MREILFRGKRIDNGEWVYGSLRVFGGDRYLPQIITPLDEFGVCHFCDVDPSTVGQYTGLTDKTDKNGKRIFEGDIVLFTWGCVGTHIPTQVVFKSGEFCMKPIGKYNFETWEIRIAGEEHNIKVIGNIHDNPELM